MIKRLLFLVAFSFFLSNLSGQTHSIFLLGDGGESYVKDSRVGKVLQKKIAEAHAGSTVIFLGDNVYPSGLPDRNALNYRTAEAILKTEVSWVQGLATQSIFIPGNHDWNHWGKDGLQYVVNQQRWIDSLRDNTISFYPKGGCPGPVEISINHGKAILLIIDSQWFLHQHEKPGVGSNCDASSESEVFSRIEDALKRNRDKQVIVAAHHPVFTYGDHGAVFTWKDHLFPLTNFKPNLYIPLPVVGSLYPLYRKIFQHIQDTGHPIYHRFAIKMHELLKNHPNSFYVAGHEHSLQYIDKDGVKYIVSGAVAKVSGVKRKGYSKFAKNVCGFAQLSIDENSRVTLHYFEVSKSAIDGKEIFTVSF